MTQPRQPPSQAPRSSRPPRSSRAPRGGRAAAWRPPSRGRVQAIRDALRAIYGIPHAQPHGRPIDELILTVLSQSTNDRNRDVAYLALRERFADWEAVLTPTSRRSRRRSAGRHLEGEVGPDQGDPAGDHRHVAGRRGSVAGLAAHCNVPAAQAYLCSLPGVGRKTAACVLLFALGMRDVPVDTHVSRVGRAWRCC